MRFERAITPTWHGENLIWLQFVKGKSRACGLLQAPKRLRANLLMLPAGKAPGLRCSVVRGEAF